MRSGTPLTNPWLALEFGADPAERVRALRRAHEAFVRTAAAPATVRAVVTESWRRSAGAHVDPDGAAAPIDLADRDLEAYRAAHPLARVLPLFREVLGGAAQDGGQLMAICDADGRLLWVEGHAAARRDAERMNFTPGAWWDERHIGTNAPGTALAVDHAVQIFAAEHFSRAVQPWTCAAAPIHDPTTGRLLGAIDITGGDQLAAPQSLALVQATARLAEAFLASTAAPAPAASLSVLGRDEGLLVLRGGARIQLGPRHSEILALLAYHPEGLTGDQLGLALYGDELNPVTLRAELSRLRRVLGPELLDSRPYRLRVPVEADFLAVHRLLEEGGRRPAVEAYRGPLLPRSEAPGVVRLRDLLANELRACLLADPDPGLLEAWTRAPWGGDDLAMWEALARSLPPGSVRRPLALARVRELLAEYAAPPGATSLQRRRH